MSPLHICASGRQWVHTQTNWKTFYFLFSQDDGSPLLCCGKCSKWQHIACHDAADRKAGHPKRNWDREEFICRACRLGPRRSIGLVNGSGRQSAALNGSSSPVSTSYDVAGRTPSPYYPHQSSTAGYTGQIPYNGSSQNHPHPSSHPRTPYQQQHSAITFSHYQPQQCGFTTNTTTPHSSALPHAQVAMSQASSTLTPYAQSHYNSAHGSSSKLTQYPNSQASAALNFEIAPLCFFSWDEKKKLTFFFLSIDSTLLIYTRMAQQQLGPPLRPPPPTHLLQLCAQA